MTEQQQIKNITGTPATLAVCRSLLQDSSGLWSFVSQYLFDFASLLDRERLRDAIAPLDSRMLAADSPCRKRLCRYALAKLGVEPCFHSFPKDDGSRILLLKTSQILVLAEWLGALSYEPALRRTIRGASVKRLEHELADSYPMVFRRSNYYKSWHERLWGSVGSQPREITEPAIVKEHGMQLLMTILGALPQALLHRMILRFPMSMEKSFEPISGWKMAEDASDLKLLFSIIQNESREGWKICCC